MDALIATLGLFGGLFTATGVAPTRSLREIFPWVPVAWGIILFLGCLAWMIGILTVVKTDHRVVIRMVPTLVLGLGLSGISALVYGLSLIAANGWSGVTASFPLLAFSAGAYLRRWKLMNLDDHD
jgi:drug/metabolite transporter (DMT)-like permease